MMSVEELVKQLRSRAYEIYGQTRYSNYLDIAADKLEELAAENERLRKALERVPDQAGHWAYVHCRVHIGSEHEDELSEFVTQKVRSFVDRALAQEKRR